MITVKKIFRTWVVLFVAIPLLIGCGDASRNDQGVSFTALGWFDELIYVDGDVDIWNQLFGDPDQQQVEYSNKMSNQTPLVSESVPLSTDTEADEGENSGILSYIGMQNNLASQLIRTERAYHEYYIPGASIQPPSTSVAVNAVLGYSPQAREEQEFGADSSLPNNMTNYMTNMVYARIPIVTPDIRTFVNMNKDNMPEPPFVMIVNTYVEGVTSSGKRIKTNEISFDIYWTPSVIIKPTVNGGNDNGGNGNNTDNVDY